MGRAYWLSLNILFCISGIEAQNLAVAHWSFDSISGNTYFDATGNGYDATAIGTGVTVESGVKGKGLLCNGSAYEITVAKSRDSMNRPRFSIESWVNLNITPSQISLGANIFNFQYVTTSVSRNGYSIHIDPQGRVVFSMSNATGSAWIQANSVTTLQQSKWYHIVCTYDSSTLKVYINGALDASVPYQGVYLPPGNDAHIGCQRRTDGSLNCHWAGKIDELSWYNFPLSADTVLSKYMRLKPADTAPVDSAMTVAHWSFDSASGLTFYDNTGHGYHAVGSGDSIRITDGLKGKALECRGPRDNTQFSTYDIQVPTSVGNFNVKHFTIEGWIYSYVDLVNPGSFYNAREIFDFASVGLEGSGIAAGFMVGCWNDGTLYFSLSTPGSWSFLSSDSVVRPNRWYHFAARYDGAAMMIFLNGRLAARKDHSVGYVIPGNAARIGCQYQITGTSSGRTRVFFNGKVDELKLYNYALDTQTIKTNYNILKPSGDRPFKINFGMKIAYAKPGDTIWVPIYLTNHENWAFCASQFNLRLNSKQLSLLSISKDSGMVKNWLLDWNRTLTDSIPVAVAGTSDTIKYGEGEFLRCKYLINPMVQDDDTCLIRMENIEIDENFHLVDAMNVPGKVIIRNPVINYGDVTGDGRVTVFDARDILSYVVGMITLPDSANHPFFTKPVADVSGSGTISSYDAALVFQYSLGMLPDFPVMHPAFLHKWGSPSGNDDVAHLNIELASNSPTDGMKFNMTGDNLRGFVAAEMAIKYDAGVANIDRGWIGTSLRGANLQSRVDPQNRLIKIAMAATDDIVTSDPVILATITLPPNSTSNPTQAFSFERAFVNEGKIPTNVLNNGIVSLGDRIYTTTKRVEKWASFRDNRLYIRGKSPVMVQLYTLGGRLCFCKYEAVRANGLRYVDVGRMSSAAYVYRVSGGNGIVESGTIVIQR